MTRSKVIQIWFAAVALIVAAALVLGVNLTLGGWGLIFAMSLVPPAMVFKLWPGAPTRSMKEMLYDKR
ncbi:MAG TPA: hypothetical protein VGY57_11180 [Vicinamibacterales bacterium]|nr:hypothetical protein [Vicinamibacterales bacterium]